MLFLAGHFGSSGSRACFGWGVGPGDFTAWRLGLWLRSCPFGCFGLSFGLTWTFQCSFFVGLGMSVLGQDIWHSLDPKSLESRAS